MDDSVKFEPIAFALIRRQFTSSLFEIEDEKKSIEITIEEYEEQDDNNDCSN